MIDVLPAQEEVLTLQPGQTWRPRNERVGMRRITRVDAVTGDLRYAREDGSEAWWQPGETFHIWIAENNARLVPLPGRAATRGRVAVVATRALKARREVPET